MDVLKNKQTKQYDYLSRYSIFPFYYNTEDNKFVYGITGQLSDKTSYITHIVKQNDSLDSLANFYYGRPDYYWVIADFNRISDCFINLYNNFKEIKIPTLSNIVYEK